jgi:type IV pilus assembly protein PilB
MSFLEELAKTGLISAGQIGEIKTRAAENFGGDVEEALLELGISSPAILEAKGRYLKIPTRIVNPRDVPFEILKYIPEDSAAYYHFVPIGIQGGVLEVGITEPENLQAMDALQFISAKSGIPFKIFLISKSDLENILEIYKGVSVPLDNSMRELDLDVIEEKNLGEVENLKTELKGAKPGLQSKIVEDAPIIKIVATIFRSALESNASDIHIEHTGKNVKVRFRVDGALHTPTLLPINVYSGIIARIKLLSKMRLDEKRKPQDGSFGTEIEGRKIDFRVSSLPAFYGEKIAMRILDSEKGVKPLEELGLSKRNLAMLREAIAKPYGLILITGPTGSGKSTTLYSMMNELDKETNNIVSLEDPVEYHIPDINQSQVMPEIGYTFASGLRSILRQDPDVIMVGEIRDKETAQLAIQAALTGHLVFSTLHTNSAIGAVPRLVDMGVDPYLIAPTLILSVAQRLARMIHPTSKKAIPMDPSVKLQIEDQLKDLPEEFRKEIEIKNTMFDAVPSAEAPSGTRGRIAVFEMFNVDKEMQSVILKSPIDSEIYKTARRKGMLLMREDAALKAIEGVIPWKEIYNFSSEK